MKKIKRGELGMKVAILRCHLGVQLKGSVSTGLVLKMNQNDPNDRGNVLDMETDGKEQVVMVEHMGGVDFVPYSNVSQGKLILDEDQAQAKKDSKAVK